MDRDTFNEMMIDDLLPIVYDEISYLQQKDPAWHVYTTLNIKEKELLNGLEKGTPNYDKISDKIGSELRELYYQYDYHRLNCKDYLGNHAINLDRHKISTVFLCMIISYRPIRFSSIHRREYPSQDLILANYRVAFRFACSYASRALHNSFSVRKEDCEKNKETTKVEMYENAMSKMEEKSILAFPATRPGLEKYVDNLIKVLYLQFNNMSEEDSIPYALLADTFYWLDVYTKMKIGVEVDEEDYPNGLRRNAPNDNNQSQETKELTTTEESETAKTKKARGKKKK